MKMTRMWAMPNANTFEVAPIADFVHRHLRGVSVDPFARNSQLATHTNDINPTAIAQFHLDAPDFLAKLIANGIIADVVIFDPPYSPEQCSRSYGEAGLTATMQTTWNGQLYAKCRKLIRQICRPGSLVLSFGWNSCGMGKHFDTDEIMLVCHGGAHNDTICMADRMRGTLFCDQKESA